MGTIDTIEQDSKTLIRNFLYAELNRSIRDEIISKLNSKPVSTELGKEEHELHYEYMLSSALKYQFGRGFKAVEGKNLKKFSLLFDINGEYEEPNVEEI